MTTSQKPIEIDKNNFVDIILNQLPFTNSSKLVEPPEFKNSTLEEWLTFFAQNAFIFFVWLLSMVWICYVIFYNSRLVGFIITKLVNYLFIKNGFFKIGSFSFASISGKIMFRDVVYVNKDYSIRIQYGWIVFCYWIPYIYRDAKTEDLSNSDVRVLIFLDGLELHVFNQTKKYADLEKLFNFKSFLYSVFENSEKTDKETREKILKNVNHKSAIKELKQSIWRDLIPMFKIEISSGRLIFGNHIIKSTLSITFEDSQFYYTSQPAASQYDLFTHILKGKAENLQVVLIPSLKYSGQVNDEPPRIMGDGFNVFRTNKIEIYYYQDVPGFVTFEAQSENDVPLPAWGVVVKCGKGTDFSYGPWADRQRCFLYSFFFPSDYQLLPVDQKPKAGERRRFESFDIRLSTLYEAKIDILFSKNKETNALHILASPGSYLEMTIPWISNEKGYTTHILGQILHLDATTSLQFRPLISSETLEFNVKIFFPRLWNDHQEWSCKITACKATISLIFAHKTFIQNLIDDWSSCEPDIYSFTPYTWRISIVIKDFELLTLANQYNWIDCSTGLNDENCKIAICGEHFDMAFDLPFIEFSPPKLFIKIWIQGECMEGAFYLPESSLNRDIIELILKNSYVLGRDGISPCLTSFGQTRKWKNAVSESNHWYECMTAPIVALSITYDYWPMPILGNQAKNFFEKFISFCEQKENLADKSLVKNFDPSVLPPDIMTVELEIGPMNLALFGTLFRFLWNLKENYLGEFQNFSEIKASFFDEQIEITKRSETMSSDKKGLCEAILFNDQSKLFDPRLYRPFEVLLSVTLHEIQGHLVQCVNDFNSYSPLIYIEKLCFELKKSFSETKLQLLISPAVLQAKDTLSNIDESFKEGFLTLSSLQFRGHAMFSNFERPIESETLEYGWLVDVKVGEICGRLTLQQLLQISVSLENFLFQFLQADLDLQSPNPFNKCLHDNFQNKCTHSDLASNKLCPNPEDIKYRLVRISLQTIDLLLVESNLAFNLIVPSVRLSTCNLHIKNEFDGFTFLLSNLQIHQFYFLSSNVLKKDQWIEIGQLITGSIFVDSMTSLSTIENYAITQLVFLKNHDSKTKKLWFLWNEKLNEKCGCVGNCEFFGCNKEGQFFFDCAELSFNHEVPQECFGSKLHNHSDESNLLLLTNLDYGESLLHPGYYLLDIHSPLIDETSKAISSTMKFLQNDQKFSNLHHFKEYSEKVADSKSSSIVFNLKQKTQIFNKASSLDKFFSTEDLKSSGIHYGNSEIKLNKNTFKKSSSTLASPAETATSFSQYYTAKDQTLPGNSVSSKNLIDSQELSANLNNSSILISIENEIYSNFEKQTITNEKSNNDETSVNSFISAMSDREDFDCVDLRNQLEKPIFESPLLMNAYSSYLSNYTGEYLNVPPPFPLSQSTKIYQYFNLKTSQAIHFERLIKNYQSCWKPKFMLKNFGFSQTNMVRKDIKKLFDNDSTKFLPGAITEKFEMIGAKNSSFFSNKEVLFAEANSFVNILEPNRSKAATSTKDEEKDKIRLEIVSSANSDFDHVSENVIKQVYIHVDCQEIQIKISALTLDVMSSFFQSASKIVSNLHPITYLNHLSAILQNEIEANNPLKIEKKSYIGQLNMKAHHLLKQRQNIKHLNRPLSFADRTSKSIQEHAHGKNLLSNNFETDNRVSLKLNFEIRRIDISSLQVSIVEEIISFSSLDKIKDLTSVLMLNLQFNNLKLKMNRLFRKQRVLHVLLDHGSVSNLSFTEKALMTRFFTKKFKKTYWEIDINAYEKTNAFISESKATFSIEDVQLQLSRMINSPEILKEATMTVLPHLKTMVNFVFESSYLESLKNHKELQDSSQQSSASKRTLTKQQSFKNNSSFDFEIHAKNFDRFIMFESGIKNISFDFFSLYTMNAVKINQKTSFSGNDLDNVEVSSKPLKTFELKGNVLDLWFHFASPSKSSSNIFKNDFDRYDWHLLSSVVPLAIAWVSVIDRVMFNYKNFETCFRSRICESISILMADAISESLNKKAIKPFYNNSKELVRIFSTMAKTIQEDPSFHLINVLRYHFKNTFKNREFESFFSNKFLIPKVEDLEKSIVLLLFDWKNVFQISSFSQNQFLFRNQQTSNQSNRITFSSTKNQIMALIEEKFNLGTLPSNNLIVHQDFNINRSKLPNIDNESVVLKLTDVDSERNNFIQNKKQFSEIDVEHNGSDYQNEISSNITRNTTSDFELKRQRYINLSSTKRVNQNRVHFVSASHARSLYENFLAFPIIRNISALLCNNSFCKIISFKQLSTTKSHCEHELQKLDSSIGKDSNHSLKYSIPDHNEEITAKFHSDQNQSENSSDDETHSSEHYVNYDNKKDLYWWMVKQQGYMKNVSSKLTNSALDKISNDQYFKLNPDLVIETDSEQNFDKIQKDVIIELNNELINQEESTFSAERKISDQEIANITKGSSDYEIMQCFELFLKKLNLTDVLDTKKIFSLNNNNNFVFSMCLSFVVKRLHIDIDESEQDIEQNVCVFKRSDSRLKSTSKLAKKDSAFVCDVFSFDAVISRLGSTQTNFSINNDFKKFETSFQPNLTQNIMNLLKSFDKKNNNEENLNYDFVKILVFNCKIEQLVQRINLPLLRFIHQFTAMYENVSQTRFEMRTNRNTQAKFDPEFETNNSIDSTFTITSDSSSFFECDSIQKDNEIEASSKAYPILNEFSKNLEFQKTNIEKCWKTIEALLDQYQQNKLQFFNMPNNLVIDENDEYVQQFGDFNFNEETFFALCSKFLNEPLIVIGNGHISNMNIVAMLSSLRLESYLTDFNFSFTHHENLKRNKIAKNFLMASSKIFFKNDSNSIIEINLSKTNLSLFEELICIQEPHHSSKLKKQLVVEIVTGKSFLSLIYRKESDDCELNLTPKKLNNLEFSFERSNSNNSKYTNIAKLIVGDTEINIPQHPVALHGMMTRSGRQLSTTLQELRYSRLSRVGRQATISTSELITSSPSAKFSFEQSTSESSVKKDEKFRFVYSDKLKKVKFKKQNCNTELEKSASLTFSPKIDFSIVLDSITIKASLLPSLQAKYCLGKVTSSGFTGSKAKFIVDINNHSLCFNTKFQSNIVEANLPSEANITLPRIHVNGEYITDESEKSSSNATTSQPKQSPSGIIFRKGSYLNLIAEISSFEHSLTTDLLNHLLFVQKVFMKEINEVLQKMSRNDSKDFQQLFQSNSSNINMQLENQFLKFESKVVLFSLHLRMSGIQITATTPTNNAVRFETGVIDLQVSNRVMNLSKQDLNVKVFLRVQLDFNLALGQLIKNSIFEEAEPDFQQLAYFKTSICMRNTLEDEMISVHNDLEDEDKEVVLITLNRPLVYIQPLAIDKAVLVWINYKNAYEFWNEQRSNLNTEVIEATQQVFDKFNPITHPFAAQQSLGTLMLQLAVDDFGICLPISNTFSLANFSNQNRIFDSDIKDALVFTLESTRISAFSRGSLVSKGQFKNLCIRFADDFETMLDDWKPDLNDSSIKNLCIVSEGTYEICSCTITSQNHSDKNAKKTNNFMSTDAGLFSDAKWILNVSWKMEGFDIHVDTSVGKHISAMFKTMTAIAGDEDDDEEYDDRNENEETESDNESLYKNCSQSMSIINEVESPSMSFNKNATLEKEEIFLTTSHLKHRKKSHLMLKADINDKKRKIEKEFNEQAKIINELKLIGASNQTIQQEMQRFQKLETVVFNNFRKGVIKKLKRPKKNEIDKKVSNLKEMNKKKNQNRSNYSFNDEIQNEKNSFEKNIGNIAGDSSQFNLSFNDKNGIDLNECVNSIKNIENKNFLEDAKGIPNCPNQKKLFNSSAIFNAEPKIDFELDVKIFFNSGKCILHTKDQSKLDSHLDMNSQNYSDLTDQINQNASPALSFMKNNNSTQKTFLNKSRSSNKLPKLFNYGQRRDHSQSVGLNPDFTVFLIPGLDIKLHYISKNILIQDDDKEQDKVKFRNDSLQNDRISLPRESLILNNTLGRSKLTKKAILFAWITLSSIPDEIFISPHILDFFEEALLPLPISMSSRTSANMTSSSLNSDQESHNQSHETPEQYVYYASFPVDVIVFFHFQPTTIRLGCLPVSRVECLLHLPSIDLVMSSNRSGFDGDLNNDFNVQQASSKIFKSYNKNIFSESQTSLCSSGGGGLSITGYLADFSLYIFHPYGGHKNKSSLNNSFSNPTASLSTERKDSLSLQVEFVKINISRSRKIVFGSDAMLTQNINFSAICDIGIATFKCDVRRLNEILAFPKAWYRKSLWRKIFIGENTLNAIFSENDELDEMNFSKDDLNFSNESHLSNSHDDNGTSSSSTNEFSLLSFESQTKKFKKFKKKSHKIAIVSNPWETLILLTMNFSKLNVSMNMGNIMGNVNWLTKDLMCNGSVSIDSNDHKKFRFGVCLNDSSLDAKGGIVGGIIELSDIRADINVCEDKDKEPQHRVSCSLHTIENRIDYMGTSILMARISDLSASFYDEWRMITSTEKNSHNLSESGKLYSDSKPSSIYVNGCLNWDQMQILMSKSTSPDFIKITYKLEEFFTQQFHSSKRVFDSLDLSNKTSSGVSYRDSIKNKARRTFSVGSRSSILPQNEKPNQTLPLFHHRHWQRALKFLNFKNSRKNADSKKYEAIIVGGAIEICAQNISLACFYGVSFRSKSWAVFSLKQPSITFMTEAQQINSDDDKSLSNSTHVIQNFSLELGRQKTTNSSDHSNRTMATVSKISRTVMFPPQFRHLHEWFNYTFMPVQIDDVNRFPSSSPDNVEFDAFGVPIESTLSNQSRQNSSDRRVRSTNDFHFKEEMIFAFPSMQLKLKTEHIQGLEKPKIEDPKPEVLCSFVSDFDDHIYVAVDAEAYFFLHDLISSYINETSLNLETFSSSLSQEQKNDREQKSSNKIDKNEITSNELSEMSSETKNQHEQIVRDFREFVCKVWHLEPTVRLHSWASKNIEPYGVDYILQRLGFSQARITIPKWIQRSTMDAFDKIISVVVYQMIIKNQDEDQNRLLLLCDENFDHENQ